MKRVTLQAEKRTEFGHSHAQQALRNGKVPGVLYGPSVHEFLYVKRHDLEKIVYTTETFLVQLNLEGKVYDTIIREVQYHPVHDYIRHVDFYAVPKDRKVTVELPLVLTGNSIGVQKGGRLGQLIRKIRVRGFIEELPSHVEVDISHLDLGQAMLIRDLPDFPFDIRMEPSIAIARIEIPRALRVEQQ